MKNLLARVITSLFLLPCVLFAFIKGGFLLVLLLMAASLAACLEAASIIAPKEKLGKIMAVIFWLGLLLPFFSSDIAWVFSFTVPMLFIFNILVLFKNTINQQGYEKLCTIFFWCFYICFGISSLYWLGTSKTLGAQGLSFIFLACASTWGNDTFAYFGGRLCGKNLLFPRVSGKKTWEGFIAGSLGSLALVLLLKYLPLTFGQDWFYGLGLGDLLWVSIPALLWAPLGDLIESRLKRFYDKKDASQILPGHGGLLDRIDGLLLVIPWTALYAFIIRGLC